MRFVNGRPYINVGSGVSCEPVHSSDLGMPETMCSDTRAGTISNERVASPA